LCRRVVIPSRYVRNNTPSDNVLSKYPVFCFRATCFYFHGPFEVTFQFSKVTTVSIGFVILSNRPNWRRIKTAVTVKMFTITFRASFSADVGLREESTNENNRSGRREIIYGSRPARPNDGYGVLGGQGRVIRTLRTLRVPLRYPLYTTGYPPPRTAGPIVFGVRDGSIFLR